MARRPSGTAVKGTARDALPLTSCWSAAKTYTDSRRRSAITGTALARIPFPSAFETDRLADTDWPIASSSAWPWRAEAAPRLNTCATEKAVSAAIAANVSASHQRMLMRTRNTEAVWPRPSGAECSS